MTKLIKTNDSSLSLEDGVAVLTFQRDDVRNALGGTSIVEDVIRTVTWANRASDVSVLLITGEGAAFSAGGNIKKMQRREGAFGGDVADIETYYRQGIQVLSKTLNEAEIPLIAAVNGPAIGAGCDLACMCDLRIGSPEAKFGETFVNLGIVPGDGGGWFLQRLIGYQRAAEMTFTGRLVEADEARDIGLLLSVVEPDALMDTALQVARTISAKPRQALRYAKRLLRKAERMDLTDYLDLSAVWQGVCHNTDDHIEAVSAFIEKRPPKFKGGSENQS